MGPGGADAAQNLPKVRAGQGSSSILSVGIAATGASFKSRGLARLLAQVPSPVSPR